MMTVPLVQPFTTLASQKLRASIDEVTADQHRLPGVVFATANKDGKLLFAHASGRRGIDTAEPMTLDSVFWIASCTKLITAIAALQLVEQNKLHLDDADEAEKLCPELRDVKILKGFDNDDPSRPVWQEKKNRITLRMCLSHTAGFGYSFLNNEIRRLGYPAGVEEFSADINDILRIPITFEPGTDWRYGTNIDWAGIMVERASGLSLDQYFKEHIFDPLGITSASFFPTDEMRSNLAHMHQRRTDGKIMGRDHLNYRPINSKPEEQASMFCSGGGGMYTKPTEYLKILSTLLNHGTSAVTSKQILKPETVDLLFSNQIPNMPNFGRVPIPGAKPLLANPIPEIYSQPHDQPQGWTFAGFNTIHPSFTGRGKNGIHWAGLANLFWWVDREKGVSGMIASQILPFGDAELIGLWVAAETAVYQALAET